METDSFGSGWGWRNRGSLGSPTQSVFLLPPPLFSHPSTPAPTAPCAMKGKMLPAPGTPGLVLGECLATGLPTQGLHAPGKDRKLAPGVDLLWTFTSYFISVLWGRGEKGKGQGERNQVTSAAQGLPIPCKGDLLWNQAWESFRN